LKLTYLLNSIFNISILNKPIIILSESKLVKYPNKTYVNAKGLKPENLLAEIYNCSKPHGLGIFQYKLTVMDYEEEQHILTILYNNNRYADFDYLYGRPIKTCFTYFPDIDATAYDSYNGKGPRKCNE
jgi:hypothetical protein